MSGKENAKKCGLIALAAFLSCLVVNEAWTGERLGPTAIPGPKYLACPVVGVVYCNDDYDWDHSNSEYQQHQGCSGLYCNSGPLRISPNLIDVCQHEDVFLNVQFSGQLGVGHAIVKDPKTGGEIVKGQVDWGDGAFTNIWSGVSLNVNVPPHHYQNAGTVFPSAVYGAQFAYTGHGSCGYVCRIQAAATTVRVHLLTSSECSGGRYHKAQSEPKNTQTNKQLSSPNRNSP